MFAEYRKIAAEKKKLPLHEELDLIAKIKNGDRKAQGKLLNHLFGFFLFRIFTTLYPSVIRQYGEDIFQECAMLAITKISTYQLDYRNTSGMLQPRHLSTYIWKAVTGVMFSHVRRKREIAMKDPDEIAALED